MGRCEFFPDEPRAPWCDPLAQRFRMVQEVNNLGVEFPNGEHRTLTDKERAMVRALLEQQNKVTFVSMKKKLKLPEGCRFNLESARRTDLKGDENAARLRSKRFFGKAWDKLPRERRNSIIYALMADHDEQDIVQRARDEQWGLSEECLVNVARMELVDGYARLSLKAIQLLLPIMERDGGPPYGKALDEMVTIGDETVTLRTLSGRHRSENLERLPYYGEILPTAVVIDENRSGQCALEAKWGRVINPTVHIALNQLQKLVNAILKRYGKPEAIVVETTRELKLGYKRVAEIEREQDKRTGDNARINRELGVLGVKTNRENRIRFRLWEELGEVSNRRCPYSGKVIAASQVFTAAVEVDHILPFSRSLDDSYTNLTLCLAEANRAKRERSPWAWWEEERDALYDMEAILRRVQASLMPDNKKRRFGPQGAAMLAEESDFLARHLNDTAYITRLARNYLACLYPANRVQVWGTPGRLTSWLRNQWRMNRILNDSPVKDRNDHRHHAVDAFVVGMISQGLLNEMGRMNARERGREEHIPVPEPWKGFREAIRSCVDNLIVSHKPDHRISQGHNHGTSGQLHEETAYGVCGKTKKGKWLACIGKKLADFKKTADLATIRDHALRKRIETFTSQRTAAGEDFASAVKAFGRDNNVYRIRVIEEKDSLITIGRKPDGSPLKGYVGGSNHAIEIFARPNGRWDGEVITTFAANQPHFRPEWPDSHPGSTLVMRLAINDMVAVGHGEERKILRVVKINSNKQVFFSGHQEAGKLGDRHKDSNDSFEYLMKNPNPMKELEIRRVGVDILGRLIDPGFHAGEGKEP